MKYWCFKLNILYVKYIKLLKHFREHSNMIYERLNETFVAHDDSSIFIAVIMSCSLLSLLGWDNKYFRKHEAKMG